MKVLYRFPEGDKVIIATKSYYYTPRVALIEYLNDPSKAHIAEWVEKGKTFKVYNKKWAVIYDEWGKKEMDDLRIMPWFCSEYLYYSHVWQADKEGFVVYTIATKATDLRHAVNDLNEAELYEWILLFLSEESRLDWVSWSDRDDLEFRILDIESMGRAFTQVNGPQTKNPSSIIRLILSSYCIAGVMKLVDSDTLKYKFNKEWYDKEIIKKDERVIYFQEPNAKLAESRRIYPEVTLPQYFNFNFALAYRRDDGTVYHLRYNDFP